MKSNEQVVAKLNIVKQMAPEMSVKQVCDIMIEYLEQQNKESVGFKDGER